MTMTNKTARTVARIETGPVGPDWADNTAAESFYAQRFNADETPGPYAFGKSKSDARRNLKAVLAALAA